MENSIVALQSSGLIHATRRSEPLNWNPIASLGRSNQSINVIGSNWNSSNSKIRVHTHPKTLKRNLFVVNANVVPGAPVPAPPMPSGPPSCNNPMSWVLGFVVSIILPFFTNKWGPLWVVKNRIENAVQTVENIVEAVEKVAEEVDKIAEDIAEDLPQGKLRDLVEMVEHVAEKTAKTADCLDNVIDKVQEDVENVEDVVESIANKPKQNMVESIDKPKYE
ncbi:uncharacterized protein LOC127257362 [Andrographis paniculata]|uniref:uncharacterized protein LOC127257362 n=1 Tax=Andrographis paniculata TaxID=175694 RepID=UPI0021E895BE|nr:uncharacterized protein LOC127257362 [Andrographis paniculata]